ncbi:hypothetical protein AUP77_19230 [Escherichia coli]|nr:hypothetical protein AUP77_19230 [Escherichia coli]
MLIAIEYLQEKYNILTSYEQLQLHIVLQKKIDNNIIARTNRDADHRNTVSINSALSLEAGLIFATYCCGIDSRYIPEGIRQLVFGFACIQLH